jgi:putative selenium metabolism hydrolase
MDEMRERIVAAAKRHRSRCAEFVRELIAIPSPSRGEEGVAMHVRREMIKVGYHEADIDRFGNVIGRIGEGRTRLVLDAHLDTTGIGDRSSWRFDPYLGDLKAGKIYGHGAANNKGGLGAIVYAGAIIKELDLATDCTVYVIGSIQAEECEGLAYKAIFDVEKLYPHFVVLSCPTGMRICRGQRGRAELQVTLRGQAVHAATPDKGFNAIYGMSRIVDGVRELNEKLPTDAFLGKATAAVTAIECDYTGPNMLPEACRIVIDRRMLPNEQIKRVFSQVKELSRGTRAKVEIVAYDKPSYRGLRLPTEKFFPTWLMPEDHPLIGAAEGAYKSIFKKRPLIDKWMMSTAGAYTMGVAKVPTIGFGPSEESYAGPVNDHVRIDDLEKAMAFYATLPGYLPDTEPIKIPRRRR